ncbi:FAD-dependent oxidoreductase [Candidatus Bipolaricaulota bacterium]|nr:FAD-dependent oxidoreductase [Candidatus Bipolaricaulota bacterium]
MSERFVIIGGDAAGMSAASKARRSDPNLEIIVLEKGEWVSYGACGLPYYVKGEVEQIEDLVAITPEEFVEKRNIDLRLNHEVTEIRPERKSIIVAEGGEEQEMRFDKLLIAVGASPIVPDIPGSDMEEVFTLHGLDDGKEIRSFVEEKPPDRAAIVGGGYIGIEMAEALHDRGLEVDVIEGLSRLLTPFNPDVSDVVQSHLSERVDVHLNDFVEGISRVGSEELRISFGGQEILSDMVVMAAGVQPNVQLAEEAGVKLGPTGAISTDEYGRTNFPDVFAAGDCAEATNTLTGGPDYVPLALTANRDGRAIGSTVGGDPVLLAEIAGTAVLKAFDLEVARTGLAVEDRARREGFDPISVTIKAPSRAGYYPGPKRIDVSLVADETSGLLLGGSMVGKEGVSKRIDTLAAALSASMTVSELENLDLSYAPPFGPTWDPLLTAAKVLAGRLNRL